MFVPAFMLEIASSPASLSVVLGAKSNVTSPVELNDKTGRLAIVFDSSPFVALTMGGRASHFGLLFSR